MTLKEALLRAKECRDKTSALEWGFGSNYPFYVDMRKPRASLSKHDSDRPSYWHYDDANYMLTCLELVNKILDGEYEKDVANSD